MSLSVVLDQNIPPVEAAETALGRLLSNTDDEILPGSLIIIDNLKIRIRRAARHG